METKENKKLGVWMDQSQAFLISMENHHPFLLEKIVSPVESMVRYPGETDTKTKLGTGLAASNHEKKTNHVHQEQLKKYFSVLEDKIRSFDEILLLGPGVLKTQFFNHITSNKSLNKTKVQVKDSDKLTFNQLLATIREHYSAVESV
jgi:hypothetical protein